MKEERKREIIQKKKINYLINLVSIYEKQFWYVIDYNMITFKIYYRMQSTAILHCSFPKSTSHPSFIFPSALTYNPIVIPQKHVSISVLLFPVSVPGLRI